MKYTASIMGGTILGAEAFLVGCTPPDAADNFFTEAEIALLDEVGETILPESDRSPGAKAAQVGEFMQAMVRDCYGEKEQFVFRSGMEELQQTANDRYGRNFTASTPEERLVLLTEYDREASSRDEDEPVHFFTMMKQLTLLGYFTSQPGVTQAMRYEPIPGGYNGCAEYREGDKAWYGWLSSIG